MSDQPKIKRKKVKEFINQMSPKGLQQLIQNLNDKQKEGIREIRFGGFLHLQADIIPEKLVVWLVWNFDTCSCSLPLANGRMRVTERDVHVMLGLPMGPLSCVTLIMWCSSSRRCPVNYRREEGRQQESISGFERGYLEDTLDKTSMTGEEEQVNEKEHHSKGVEDEGKAKDQIGISKVKDGRVATDLVITSSRRLAENRVGGVDSWSTQPTQEKSVSDALIRDTRKRSKSRTPVLSQDSFESEGFLMQINVIPKHFGGSRDKFAIPSFSVSVSQEKKESLPEGAVIIDSQPDSLIMLCSQDDNDAFIDRSLMRIIKPNLQIRDVQTTTNTDKSKAALVEAPKRRRTRSAQCSIAGLLAEWALKFYEGVTEKRTYQKAFTMRMSTRSCSSPVAQLNEAQAEAVRLMGFASFLKVDLKQIPGKFSKWLVESFDPYTMCFRLPDGQKFPVTTFNVYVSLGVHLGGREIIEITKSSTDEEYNEVHARWLKEWKVQPNAAELTECRSSLRGRELEEELHHIFSELFCQRTKNRYYSKSILEYVKDALQGEYSCKKRAFRRPTVSLHKPDCEAQIPRDTLVADANVIVEKEDHREDVPDSQSPVPQTNSVPDSSTAGVNEDDGGEDDDDGALSRSPLRNTLQVNRELSVKKLAENKPKESDEPSSKKDEKKGSPRACNEQQAPDSSKPKLTKEVLPEKDHEKCVGAARTPKKLEEVGPSGALRKRQPENLPLAYYSPYVILLTKLNSELSQDELVISEYEATRVSMAILKVREEVEMNVINIWSSILNDRERKRDLTTPNRLFMSGDQSVSASQSTSC
ncbi:hypothetical protein Cgig2_020041 [Carnegiea gigantea]|uniref:Uncharacterized protein n=1 Tax=Carnegiea gigantea TaxID=171969 RepID=A0A9Q1GJ40_9CARY|nr:hypothetical protein Cgig2_020041 [Carnegiea gigantea]